MNDLWRNNTLSIFTNPFQLNASCPLFALRSRFEMIRVRISFRLEICAICKWLQPFFCLRSAWFSSVWFPLDVLLFDSIRFNSHFTAHNPQFSNALRTMWIRRILKHFEKDAWSNVDLWFMKIFNKLLVKRNLALIRVCTPSNNSQAPTSQLPP